MKRPFGVLFSALLLGLLAAGQLVLAAIFALLVHIGATPLRFEGTTQPIRHFDTGSFLLLLFCLLMAAWTLTTLTGLLRLRPWSCRSMILYAAACLALGSYPLLRRAYSFTTFQHSVLLPGSIPASFFSTEALVEIFLVSLGICWLLYFNFPSVKSYFLPYIAPAQPTRSRRIPNPILLLALIYFTTSALFLFFLTQHLPGLFFGHPTPGPWVYAGGAAAMTLAGFGLLRLDPRARLATFALLTVGMANAIVSALPHFREPLNLFAIAVLQRLQAPRPLATAYSLTSGSTLPAILLLASFTLYFAYALHRYRSAFHHP